MPSDVMQLSTPGEAALLAVCRNTHNRSMVSLRGNFSAAQLAIAQALRQAGFELDEDNDDLIARLQTIFAVLDDGRRAKAQVG